MHILLRKNNKFFCIKYEDVSVVFRILACFRAYAVIVNRFNHAT